MREKDEDLDRIQLLEKEVKELWERMRQFEAVMSTAFRLAPLGELKRHDTPNCECGNYHPHRTS